MEKKTKGGRNVVRYKDVTTYTILKSGAPAHGGHFSTSGNWDIIEELYFEGAHLEHGSWHSQTWVYENKNPGGRVEHDQVELKKDDDAKWEVRQVSTSKIEYTLSAASCTFSCDEVKIRVYIRWVNP